MSAAVEVSTACKQAKSNATKSQIDAGAGAGKLELYTSPRTTIDSTVTATLIASIPLADPCGTVDASGLHLSAPLPAQAIADGFITWGRVVDSNGNPVFSGAALESTDPNVATAAFVIDKAQMYAGGFVGLTAATLQEGG